MKSNHLLFFSFPCFCCLNRLTLFSRSLRQLFNKWGRRMDGIKGFNINEVLDDLRKKDDNETVKHIVESFEGEKYSDVIYYMESARDSYQNDEKAAYGLSILELLSNMQLDRKEAAEVILNTIYSKTSDNDSERLLILGELATAVNIKIARKILSQLVKLLDGKSQGSSKIVGKAYLLLAEVEESLQKLPRAIKYYQQGLELFSNEDAPRALQSFIYYKVGILSSSLGNKDEAIDSLKKGLELANNQVENKIPILVSLGKILGSIEKEEEAFSFLSEALDLIEQSTLNNNIIHAEALTEVAYYYFDSGKVDQAIPFYEKAITIYGKGKGVSNRKLGMIHMQYAYCLEHKEQPNLPQAGMQYENGLRYLEETGDRELYENALMDVISFFTTTNNKKKKRTYENKFLKLSNQ